LPGSCNVSHSPIASIANACSCRDHAQTNLYTCNPTDIFTWRGDSTAGNLDTDSAHANSDFGTDAYPIISNPGPHTNAYSTNSYPRPYTNPDSDANNDLHKYRDGNNDSHRDGNGNNDLYGYGDGNFNLYFHGYDNSPNPDAYRDIHGDAHSYINRHHRTNGRTNCRANRGAYPGDHPRAYSRTNRGAIPLIPIVRLGKIGDLGQGHEQGEIKSMVFQYHPDTDMLYIELINGVRDGHR
jgi:hypothetical protein